MIVWMMFACRLELTFWHGGDASLVGVEVVDYYVVLCYGCIYCVAGPPLEGGVAGDHLGGECIM